MGLLQAAFWKQDDFRRRLAAIARGWEAGSRARRPEAAALLHAAVAQRSQRPRGVAVWMKVARMVGRRTSRATVFPAAATMALLVGCGSTGGPSCEHGDGGCVAVSATAEDCPTVTSMGIAPAELDVGAGGTSTLTAVAAEPGGGSPTVHWSATSGDLGDANAATTTFSCTVAGPVVLTVAVTNGVCGDRLSGTITCLDLPDAGAD
jgi:hypothetical protein